MSCICGRIGMETICQQLDNVDLSGCPALADQHVCICEDPYYISEKLLNWRDICLAKTHCIANDARESEEN